MPFTQAHMHIAQNCLCTPLLSCIYCKCHKQKHELLARMAFESFLTHRCLSEQHIDALIALVLGQKKHSKRHMFS